MELVVEACVCELSCEYGWESSDVFFTLVKILDVSYCAAAAAAAAASDEFVTGAEAESIRSSTDGKEI